MKTWVIEFYVYGILLFSYLMFIRWNINNNLQNIIGTILGNSSIQYYK